MHQVLFSGCEKTDVEMVHVSTNLQISMITSSLPIGYGLQPILTP